MWGDLTSWVPGENLPPGNGGGGTGMPSRRTLLLSLLAVLLVVAALYAALRAYRHWRAKQPVAAADGPVILGSLAAAPAEVAAAAAAAHSGAPAEDKPRELLPSALLRGALRDEYTVSLLLYYSPTPAGAPLEAVPLVTSADAFTLAVDPAEQQLVVKLPTHRDSAADPAGALYTMRLPDFKANRWHGVTLAVSGRTVDLYHDGRLVRAARLDTLPRGRPTELVVTEVGTTVTAAVAKVRAYPRRLPAPEAAALYAGDTDERGAPRLPRSLLPPWLTQDWMCASERCRAERGAPITGDGASILVHDLE